MKSSFFLLFFYWTTCYQPGTVWQILSFQNRPHKSTGEWDFSLIITLWSPYTGQYSHMITFMGLSATQRWNKWLLLPHMNISRVTFIFQIKTASRMRLWICWEQSHELDLYSPFLRHPLCRCVQLFGPEPCWHWDTATNTTGPNTHLLLYKWGWHSCSRRVWLEVHTNRKHRKFMHTKR